MEEDKYRVVSGKNGKRYMKNNKFISKDKVPKEFLDVEAQEIKVEEKLNSKNCIICGGHAKHSRFVNLRMIPICEDHYHSTTVGKIAQAVREGVGHATQER